MLWSVDECVTSPLLPTNDIVCASLFCDVRLGSTMRHLGVNPIGGLTSSVSTKTRSASILMILVERLPCSIGAMPEIMNLPCRHLIVRSQCISSWVGQ